MGLVKAFLAVSNRKPQSCVWVRLHSDCVHLADEVVSRGGPKEEALNVDLTAQRLQLSA